ncbi:MAG: 3,4-dihydroxy 2-butanone 4-phosphate synthase [Thelocarpon impressellum]|nr:MAG: 3,4-dihydroxy 2-butanone 4-phosphate synthase [Thelocarpon impressellum]
MPAPPTPPEPVAAFDSIDDTVAAFRGGAFVVVLDSPARENEGDLIIAASHMTTERCAFMIRHTSGYICAPLPATRAAALDLAPMVPPAANADPNRTAYTVSVDAADPAVSTGISAHDRALTCRALADARTRPAGLRRPGHVLPLVARAGGVRERRGHTEAAVELCRLSGTGEVGVICELVDDGEEAVGGALAERKGGGMLRRDGCLAFARRWGLRCCTIEDLVEHVERGEARRR